MGGSYDSPVPVRQEALFAGMCSMLVVGVAVAWGWLFVQTRPNDSGFCLWLRYLKCSRLCSKTR
jgi:hypothetical protein